MRLALVLAALVPVVASAQGIRPGYVRGRPTSTVAMYLPFLTPGCYASGTAMGTRGETVSITRATTATYEDCSGVVQTCASGQMRVGCSGGTVQGLLVERASTNYVLNNRTHPKAAEATGSLSTGAHVAWHEGTGTMTVAAGTATVTGLSCTAVSPGTLCTFTVTVAGTMAITTSAGTVTKAQIETGSTKTSEIPTAGTAVARNADAVTVATPAGLDPARWCVETTATPYGGRAWNLGTTNQTTANAYVTALGAANSWTLYLYNGTANFNVTDGAGGTRSLSPAFSGWGASERLSGATSSSLTSVRRGSVALGSTTAGGTGAMSAWPATINLGGTGAQQADSYLKDFRIYRSPTCR